MNTHLFTYRHDGGTWIVEIKARDAEDAKVRIARLQYATYDGVLVAKIPAGAGWFAAAACWLRNALSVR